MTHGIARQAQLPVANPCESPILLETEARQPFPILAARITSDDQDLLRKQLSLEWFQLGRRG